MTAEPRTAAARGTRPHGRSAGPARWAHRLCVPAALLLAAAPAWAAPPPPPRAATYPLTPYAATAPALATAWQALHGTDTRALAEAHEALAAAQGAPGALGDPLDARLARLLLGRLLDRLGDHTAAHDARAPLLAGRGSLPDEARLDEAAALTAAGDAEAATPLLWAVSSASLGHVQAARRAVSTLVARGRWREAAGALQTFLDQPLGAATRPALTLRAAALWARAARHAPGRREAAEDRREARQLLRALWWDTPAAAEAAARALRSLDSPLTYGDEVAIRTLHATSRSRRGVRETWREVRKLRARTAQDRRIRAWARQLLDARLARDAQALGKPLRRLEALERRLGRGPFGAYNDFSLASLLRRAGRDEEAVARYDAVARRAPDHVLTPRARVEAAGLTNYLGRAAEAAARWEEAARALPRGDEHRHALWHAGFDAWRAGDPDRARAYLEDLRDHYGGEQDATGLSWAARAAYWLGRVAEDAGDGERAARWFSHTVARFPVSYYALLARQRLAALAVALPAGPSGGLEPTGLAVARAADLDWTVALWRLGEIPAARRAAEGLLRVGRLPGSGRALLARIYDDAGQVRRASRVLRRRGVLAALPGGADARALAAPLREAFALPYRAELEAAAQANGLPLALLAGLVHVESRFNPKAHSTPGAVGLTQVMPKTARAVAKVLLGREVGRRALRDPATNVAVGARLLRELLEHFGGNPALAVAAYNAGHGAVRGWLRSRGHLPTDAFVEAIPYGQARNYVRRVLSVAETYRRLYTPAAPRLYVPVSPPLTLGPFFEEARQ